MPTSIIYKLLDKLEMNILKGAPIPVTPWVIVNHEIIIDILNQIKVAIPNYKLLDELEMKISKGVLIPHTKLVIVNHNSIIKILDNIRAAMPKE